MQRFWKILLIIEYFSSFVWFGEAYMSIDYCTVQCADEQQKHILCILQNQCPPSEGVTSIRADNDFRDRMTRWYNSFREEIASGKIRGAYGNRGATNMRFLYYDMELERFAQCLADRRPDGIADKGCVDSERFVVTYNFHVVTEERLLEENARKLWSKGYSSVSTAKWVKEYSLHDSNEANMFLKLVMSVTNSLGCGKARNSEKAWIYCLFGPALVDGKHQQVYEMASSVSEIASECLQRGTIYYPSLCYYLRDDDVLSKPPSTPEPIPSLKTIRRCEIYYGPFLINILVYYL